MEFEYKASTAEGKISHGKIFAEDEKRAVSKVHAMGLIPLSVHLPGAIEKPRKTLRLRAPSSGSDMKKAFSSLAALKLSLGRKVKNKDLIMFSEHLATMLKAGITLNKCLTILADLTENKAFAKVIQDVHNQIREGSTLHQALEKYPAVFPGVFVNMVRAGESGGVLEVVLQRVSEFLTEIQELKDYLISSMIYPAILGFTAIGSILIMLIIVVPRFAEIFTDMGIDLPMATQIMLVAGNFLQAWWWALFIAVLSLVAMFKYFVATPGGRDWWDRFKLGLPLIGPILLKVEIARFSKTLGTLLNSGVSILAAMNIVKGVVVNNSLKLMLDQVYDDLKQGRMLSSSLERHRVFPSLAVNMLGVGEESGNMPEMLEKVGDMYDKDLKAAIKSFTALFEPMVILVMGLVIGAMVVSMLLAIFSLNELGI
ncbi:type II secretion system F family protein [Desulfonatronovibrio magnus]|uniref:type II secretion system F family protein n=1 Tax=Desulfonatronovibrio magnus TaxID=698827 RepID=UPI0005EBD7D4|nr:type II secretion system F family protein [Desulfonatronovibrio magnus]